MEQKKNMLILGGYSKKNIGWMKQMKKNYKTDYNVFTLEYENWFTADRMDFEVELKKISEIVKEKQIDIVIAKSIGMYLLIKSIDRQILKPSTSILLGYPYEFFKEENINIIDNIVNLKNNTNILLIQQENDPQCSAELVKKITNNFVPIITIKGNDHSYNEFITIKKHVDGFINLNIVNEEK